jgi:hypothetical protein
MIVAEHLPAARVGDFAICAGSQAPDVLIQGASTVLVNGLPWCAMTDVTAHGGLISMGAGTVQIGGAAFSPPANFFFSGPPEFQNKVIRDVFLLSTLPSGRRLLDRLGQSFQPIDFVPELDPSNSFCAPHSDSDAQAGKPTGSSVMYNPDAALTVYDAQGGIIDMPPQILLGHELVHALNNAEGKQKYGTDPDPPESQPDIEEEEASAIGTGSHGSSTVSENALRHDLGIARRDNHYGNAAPGPTGDVRPGGY